jgi:hypothetical protein
MSTPEVITPAAGMPLPEASGTVGPAPEGGGDWRNHIFFFWLSIFGIVATTLCLVLSIYFYQAAQVKPLLTFGVHPLKMELQRPDFDKELGFIYKGKPVESEGITSVQVSIWNAGTRSIRDSDVLDPFRLVMPDGSAILSVRAKKTSRPISGFEILGNQEDYNSGICRLKWRILEPGDGAVLQIIYAGGARRDPTLVGTVEGQKGGILVEQYDMNPDMKTVSPTISTARLIAILALISLVVFLIFIATRIQAMTTVPKTLAEEIAEAEKHLAELRKRTGPMPLASWIIIFVAGVVLVSGLWVLVLRLSTGPPFGW